MKRHSSSLLFAISLVLAPASHAADAAAVRTVQPSQVELKRTTAQPGTVHPFHEATLFAKVAGYAAAPLVDIGDEVKKGQILLELLIPEMKVAYEKQQAEVALLERKQDQLQAAVAIAEADAGGLQSELERVQSLLKTKAVTQRIGDETRSRYESAQAKLTVARREVQSAEASVEVARKGLEELEVLLQYATIRAPFDGVVTQRGVDPGDLVRNQAMSSSHETPLFTVAKIDRLRIVVGIPERDAVWVRKGNAATLSFAAFPGLSHSAPVSRVTPQLDSKTRSRRVEIDLENPDRRLLPGMYANVILDLETKPGLALPAGAVRFDGSGNESLVYVLKDGNRIAQVPVKTGLDDGVHIEITDGLSGSEQVVTGMLGRLEDGQTVRVIGE